MKLTSGTSCGHDAEMETLPLWASRVLNSDLGRSRPAEARVLVEKHLGRKLIAADFPGEVLPGAAAVAVEER